MTKHYNKFLEKEKRRSLRREETYCEKLIWRYLRKRQMLGYKFKRQFSVDHFVIDFYCPELKLALEVDGDVHNQPEQKDYDSARQQYLEQFGITFIRISNEELLGNPNKAFDKIEGEIKRVRKQ
jgi:very-short-patch-repair endonuclease